MRLGVRAALVDRTLIEGDVEIRGERVARLGARPPGTAGIAVPGFVDLQVNGFAGVDFLAADVEGYRQAGEALAATGVTAFLPTLVSSPLDAYDRAIAAVAGLHDGPGPRALGVHLEGPFLAPRWAGAHDPAHLREPDPGLARRLCAAGPVRMMTLAPELPGALAVVDALTAAGVVASCGHSDAHADAAHAGFDRGARAITHVHNAHRRWRARDPGLGGVALARPDVAVQAIVDGVHLAPETAYATLLAARGRFCLVTDATEAAGVGPGEHRLGTSRVRATDGAVRLQGGTLAGSLLTMDRAVRNLTEMGASMADAVEAAARVPARLIGRPDLGALREGGTADLVVLDDELRVARTLVGGAEAFARG
jgi:N-acetylglucosamine-6-phosphate deacetylase